MLQVLGLRAHPRRTDRLGDLATSLAVEVAYAKAARAAVGVGGGGLERRSIRREVLQIAPERLGPGIDTIPIVLLDGTGVRPGDAKLGVAPPGHRPCRPPTRGRPGGRRSEIVGRHLG